MSSVLSLRELIFSTRQETWPLGFDALERVLGLLLVVDVEFHQALAGVGEAAEVGGKWDAGQLALQVGGVAGAILGVVEQGVGVVEDVPLGDGSVGVVGAKFVRAPSR